MVFSKKEVSVVLTLLILVALLSFTIGLRLGKALGAKETAISASSGTLEHPPLAEKKSSSEDEEGEDEEEDSKETKPVAPPPAVSASAEKVNEAKLSEEVKSEGLKTDHPIVTSLPEKKKKSEISGYTLQVGAYKTVGEATEQVSELKRKGLEKTFYFEAEIPGKGTWYRVGIGVYTSRGDAEREGQRLRSQGEVPAFIIQRIGE